MSDSRTKLRINFGVPEIEIECDSSEANGWIDRLVPLVSAAKVSVAGHSAPPKEMQHAAPSTKMPSVFGEYLHQFPREVSDTDRVLIAGYFVQVNGAENEFATRSANELLQEQGVKISNASDCVGRMVQQRRIYAVSSGKYRVSKDGIDYLNSLKASSV